MLHLFKTFFFQIFFVFLLTHCGLVLKTTSSSSDVPSDSTSSTSEDSNSRFENLRWNLIDTSVTRGLNSNSSDSADSAGIQIFNSKVYSSWTENVSGTSYIKVAVYNPSEINPNWTLVGSNSFQGGNQKFSVFQSKLYMTWIESLNNGTLHVAVYNGNDSAPSWTQIDGTDTTIVGSGNTYSPELIDFNSKLYLAWGKTNVGNSKIRIAVYNGNDSNPTWSFVDTSGISNGASVNNPRFAKTESILFLAWLDTPTTAYSQKNQIRVARFNGNDSSPNWSLIDGGDTSGLNRNPYHSANYPALVALGTKLYAAWNEDNGTGSIVIRVSSYNTELASSTWTSIESENGLNADATHIAMRVQLISFKNQLVAFWREHTTAYNNNNYSSQTVRVAAYNPQESSPSWYFIDNDGVQGNASTGIYHIEATSSDTKLYTIWSEITASTSYARVAASE